MDTTTTDSEEAEVLVDLIREYLDKAPACSVELTLGNLPDDIFERAPGVVLSDHAKRERFGEHVIVYAKKGW